MRHCRFSLTLTLSLLLIFGDTATNSSILLSDSPFAIESRIVFSPAQAATLAQGWVQFKSSQIKEWQGAAVGSPVIYYDLDGVPVVYVFSVLREAQDVGYVTLTYEAREYPVVEFSINLAPHLRCDDVCRRAAARQGLRLDQAHPIYLGLLDYFFEALPASNTRRRLLPLGGEQIVALEHRPRVAQFQDTVATTIPPLGEIAFAPDAIQKIYGLPDYNQFYGPSCGYDFDCYSGCMPTAATNVAHFWADAGYPSLGDVNWRDTTADLFTHTETFCLGDEGSTRTDKVAPGLISFAQSRGYNFDSLQYCWPTSYGWVGCEGREFTWERYSDEIDQCRPPLLSIFNHPLYAAHSVTGVGYDTSGGNYYIVHDNWRSTPREVWILHEDADNRYRFLYPFIPPIVDHTPPSSVRANIWPAFSTDANFEVSWSAADTFPGVGSYDVQYRDGLDGEWQEWIQDATETSTLLGDDESLQIGHTYYARARARDKHCNVGEWSAPSNGAIVVRHSVSGRVMGNRGRPAFQAQVSSSNAYTSTTVGAMGEYALFFLLSETIDVSARPSSGEDLLPPLQGITLTEGISDVTGVDLVLPPPDNVIQDSHFEQFDPSAHWTLGGIVTPTLTQQAHTGDYAIVLGALPTPTQVSEQRISAEEWYWTIFQTVTLSATVERPTLSWLYAVSGTVGISDLLTVTVRGPGEPLSYTIPLSVTGWRHGWLALDETGVCQDVTVSFVLRCPSTTALLIVYLDEITLGSVTMGQSTLSCP